MATATARDAAIELLSQLADVCVVVIDPDRAVDITARFLTVQQEVTREGTARDVVERIEARAGGAAQASAQAWGLAVAEHVARVYGLRRGTADDGEEKSE